LKKQERAAIEAVAAHFAATWEPGEGPPDAYMVAGRKRIAIEVTAMPRWPAHRAAFTKPRLRFDRVVLALTRHLQVAVRDAVSEDKTMLLTVTAPIRLAAKTAATLEDRIKSCLARGAAPHGKETIYGNLIQFRLVKGGSKRSAKVIGFVHHRDSDPGVLIDLTQSLLERIRAEVRKRVPTDVMRDCWLVVAGDNGFSHVEAYRHLCFQLSPTGFKKILMVSDDGQVESLTG
jgi:hypothetical protein